MTAATQDILDAFERLPEPDRLGLAAEILRRMADRDVPPIEDADLARNADLLFRRLDVQESADGQP